MLLENVSNILKMIDVMEYLLKAWCCSASHIFVKKHQCSDSNISNSNLGKECRKRGLLIRWVTLNGHHVGAPVWPSKTSTFKYSKITLLLPVLRSGEKGPFSWSTSRASIFSRWLRYHYQMLSLTLS